MAHVSGQGGYDEYSTLVNTWDNASTFVSIGSYLVRTLEGPEVPEVPLPPAFLLFGSGLFGLMGIARRKKV